MEQEVFHTAGGGVPWSRYHGDWCAVPVQVPREAPHPCALPAGSPPTWDSLRSWVPVPSFLQGAARHVAVPGSPASLLGLNSGSEYGVQQGHSFN